MCTDKWYWMILIAIDIVYRQMVLNDINSNRYCVQTNGIELILIAIDIVYRQMVLNDINSNRYCVQTNGIEWY